MEKLVRDKIPEIVLAAGEIRASRVLMTTEEKWHFLKLKLQEEVGELLATSHPLDEMSDVIEVVEAMKAHFEHAVPGALEQARRSKADAKGQFFEWFVMDF